MIYLLEKKSTATQMQEMLQEYEGMVKIVVDIRRKILAGGGEMHSDCEAVLLDHGSADHHQRTLLSAQAKEWSDKTLQYSGLI